MMKVDASYVFLILVFAAVFSAAQATIGLLRTARVRQSQPQAGWPARAALSTKGRACLVPWTGCEALEVTL